jgi:hemoglobin/transferrin/lactoferrin receptor protein
MKKIIIAMLMPVMAFAQNNNTDTLKEIIVSGTKYATSKNSIVQKVDVITANDIATTNAPSTGDLLMQSGQVFVQKSQLGGSSPVIRGFEANRILIMVDGVRMNNAIYRGGHLQNIITVDQNMLSKLEIVSGPSSTLYGSDAMGGVINLQTKKVKLNTTNKFALTNLGAFGRYSSAANELTGHADFTIANNTFGSLTSITVNNFGDLKAGANRASEWGTFGLRKYTQDRVNNKDTILPNSNTALQTGSGYNQYDFLQKFYLQSSKKMNHTLNLQYSTSSNVPRFDRLGEVYASKVNGADSLGWAQWYYGPQNRLLAAYGLNLKQVGVFNEVNATLSYQNIYEERNQRRFAAKGLDTRQEKVQVYGADINGIIKKNKYDVVLGADFQANNVSSEAFRTYLANDSAAPIKPRYAAGGNTLNTFGLYAQSVYTITADKLFINAGLRYGISSLYADFSNTTFYKFPYTSIKQNYNAFTGNIGAVYLPIVNHKITFGLSTGFKAPNLDEVTKFIDNSAQASAVVVPNEKLTPERAYNFDLAYEYKNKNIHIGASAFYTLLDNAMVLDNAQYLGSDSIVFDGAKTKVISITNQANATVRGLNIFAGYNYNRFYAEGAINFTQGSYKGLATYKGANTSAPLDHIPPTFGKITIGYKTNKFDVAAWSIFNGRKDTASMNPLYFSEDNAAYALPSGMPAWTTFNIRGSYQITRNLQAQLGVENLLDTYYRHFASGIAAPGRNIIVAIRYKY